MRAPAPFLFYVAKLLEALGIGTFLVAILVAVPAPDISAYGTYLPIGALLFGAGWLIERRLGTRP